MSAPITVTTGAGNDSIHFQAGPETFAAPINVFADTGDNKIEFKLESARAVYLKPVKVVSNSTGTDTLLLRNASFLGGFDARLGGGISSVDIDDVFFRGNVVIDTAAGNDAVRIEPGSTAGRSILAALMELKLGEGDDTVLIGDGTLANTILLMARLTIDGGGGADTINDVLGFAQVVPGGTVNVLEFP